MIHRPKKSTIFLALSVFCFAAAFGASYTNAQLVGDSPFVVGQPFTGSGPSGLADSPLTGGGPTVFEQQTTISTVKQSTSGPQVSLNGYCSGFTANVATGSTKLGDLFKYFTCVIQRMIVPLLMSLGGLFFVMGMVKFITSSDSESRAEGKQFMIWGVVGFAVIFSLWGIITIFKDTFRLQNAAPEMPTTPKIQGQ